MRLLRRGHSVKGAPYPIHWSRGVDFAGAEQLARRVIWALSLPGKVAPISAARAIRDTVYCILSEEGML